MAQTRSAVSTSIFRRIAWARQARSPRAGRGFLPGDRAFRRAPRPPHRRGEPQDQGPLARAGSSPRPGPSRAPFRAPRRGSQSRSLRLREWRDVRYRSPAPGGGRQGAPRHRAEPAQPSRLASRRRSAINSVARSPSTPAISRQIASSTASKRSITKRSPSRHRTRRSPGPSPSACRKEAGTIKRPWRSRRTRNGSPFSPVAKLFTRHLTYHHWGFPGADRSKTTRQVCGVPRRSRLPCRPAQAYRHGSAGDRAGGIAHEAGNPLAFDRPLDGGGLEHCLLDHLGLGDSEVSRPVRDLAPGERPPRVGGADRIGGDAEGQAQRPRTRPRPGGTRPSRQETGNPPRRRSALAMPRGSSARGGRRRPPAPPPPSRRSGPRERSRG